MNDPRYARWTWLVAADAAAQREAQGRMTAISHICIEGYVIDQHGELRPLAAKSAYGSGLEPGPRGGQGVRQVFISVRSAPGPIDGVAAWLDDGTARRRLLAGMLRLVEGGTWDGLELELRGAFPHLRDQFTVFAEELSWKLRQAGRQLAITVAPQVRDPQLDRLPEPDAPPSRWVEAYAASFDYRALSVYADLFLVRTLDHPQRPEALDPGQGPPWWSWAPAAVTPQGWLESVIEHALLHVAPRKLLIALPLYGREWCEGERRARCVPLAALSQRLAAVSEWSQEEDRMAGGRRYRYRDEEGRLCTLCIDTPASLAEKAALVARYDLGGLALRRLGWGTAAVWEALERALAMGGDGEPGDR